MLLPKTSKLHFNLQTRPISETQTYSVNDEPDFPAIALVRGIEYCAIVKSEDNLFAFYSSSSEVYFEFGENAVRYFTLDKDTPDILEYRNNNQDTGGLIYVYDSYPVLSSGLVPLTQSVDTVEDLVSKFNCNAEKLITAQNSEFGSGLKLVGKEVTLQEKTESGMGNLKYFLSRGGEVLAAETAIIIDDSLDGFISTVPSTISDVLDQMAKLLRLIKDPEDSYTAEPVVSIVELGQLSVLLQEQLQQLNNRFLEQEAALKTISDRAKAALDSWESHEHDASDITSGLINPNRLGLGSPTASKRLNGDSVWRTLDGAA